MSTARSRAAQRLLGRGRAPHRGHVRGDELVLVVVERGGHGPGSDGPHRCRAHCEVDRRGVGDPVSSSSWPGVGREVVRGVQGVEHVVTAAARARGQGGAGGGGRRRGHGGTLPTGRYVVRGEPHTTAAQRPAQGDPKGAARPRGMAGKVGSSSLRPSPRAPKNRGMEQRTVLVVLFDDVQSLDVTGPVEVFAGADAASATPGAATASAPPPWTAPPSAPPAASPSYPDSAPRRRPGAAHPAGPGRHGHPRAPTRG